MHNALLAKQGYKYIYMISVIFVIDMQSEPVMKWQLYLKIVAGCFFLALTSRQETVGGAGPASSRDVRAAGLPHSSAGWQR